MELFDKIKSPYLLGKKITLSDITEKDKTIYYKIYTDDELNKFWGYDYKEVVGFNVNEDYFYDFQNALKLTKEEYSLAIRLDDKMIGEFVFHGFEEKCFEIGFRILPDYQNKGYVKDAIKTVIDYSKNYLQPDYIKAKCFKQNTPSFNLLTACEFVLSSEDDIYYYFVYKIK